MFSPSRFRVSGSMFRCQIHLEFILVQGDRYMFNVDIQNAQAHLLKKMLSFSSIYFGIFVKYIPRALDVFLFSSVFLYLSVQRFKVFIVEVLYFLVSFFPKDFL